MLFACTVAFMACRAVRSSLKASLFFSRLVHAAEKLGLKHLVNRHCLQRRPGLAGHCISPVGEHRGGPAGLSGMRSMGLQCEDRWRAQMSCNRFLQRRELAVSLVVSAVNGGESCCYRGIYSGRLGGTPCLGERIMNSRQERGRALVRGLLTASQQVPLEA